MTIPYQLINLGLAIMSLPGRMSLARASRNPEKASARTLRKILNLAKNTAYGKEHHFGAIVKARKPEQLFRLYEKSVRASEYESFRPYVERHKHGEANVLIPGKPLMYATTSGTTSKPKWIPISQKYMKDVYDVMSHIWLDNFARVRPKFLSGGLVVSVAKVVEGYAEDGTIFGSVSGVTAKKIPSIIRKRFVTPPEVYDISDYTARYYVMMRLAIAHSVSYIVAPNPSTLLELIHNAEEYFDDYIEDIEKGSISEKFDVSPEIRSVLAGFTVPDPERADFLRRVKEKCGGKPQLKDWWPDMQLLSSWKCGNTAIAAEKVQQQLPAGCCYQELGYFASECRFGLVLDEGIDSTLFPNYHYYEFIEESDLENPEPRFLRLHELEQGKRYCIYVTTFSGLYRYNMNDLVEVGGWNGKTPKIHMVQKVNGIVSITGEKLYEKQFIEAVHEAERQSGLKANFFIGFADPEEACYDFYYEFEKRKIRRSKAEAFTKIVDSQLMEMNIEYQSKRASHRLKEPKTFVLKRNAYDHFKRRSLLEGARDGQFKLVMLLQDKRRQRWINSLIED
ncbi:MAG: GH3 auxin-responsive promoter family protein [Candidatus Cryptobacteroides sp.]|nr:GH3 auxin-responsive promoter family protein [Bacteroidales bacterium]MDY2706245.1 GH3 auxin-responsive promoter family protein [Candidatus Cryptobacteroides sp.]MDD6509412.1 GH3 auxin-responsive promoter family protein [Bacteroidales bacterium]MDD7531995.1 GH3 auxin-responsive promoter family protein [Bacteroidales bacterium]MDY2857574.1 GH3 auxin-responsive promoter family protein [Candidatus Cryptobacteroides sp.]